MKNLATTLVNKAAYQNLLRKGICEVVFEKKDGSSRTMRATLEPYYISDNGLTPVGGGANPGNEQQIRCCDVDKGEWRSFNIDSVSSFTVE